ncbi:MAG: AF1514 family protein [Gammaproteobacteria bacterium]|nr:AF1514 family protein [Gammaproteobacteria bacterium]
MDASKFKIIELQIERGQLDYYSARSQADRHARSILSEPMLIAWYDGIKKEEHPQVPECQHKPGWIAYAEGHGGTLQININGQMFCFIYTDAADSI